MQNISMQDIVKEHEAFILAREYDIITNDQLKQATILAKAYASMYLSQQIQVYNEVILGLEKRKHHLWPPTSQQGERE